MQQLTELRRGRGGRVSKYRPIRERVENLKKGKALRIKLSQNEVGGLRAYLKRYHGESLTVKSSHLEENDYAAFVFHTSDLVE